MGGKHSWPAVMILALAATDDTPSGASPDYQHLTNASAHMEASEQAGCSHVLLPWGSDEVVVLLEAVFSQMAGR